MAVILGQAFLEGSWIAGCRHGRREANRVVLSRSPAGWPTGRPSSWTARCWRSDSLLLEKFNGFVTCLLSGTRPTLAVKSQIILLLRGQNPRPDRLVRPIREVRDGADVWTACFAGARPRNGSARQSLRFHNTFCGTSISMKHSYNRTAVQRRLTLLELVIVMTILVAYRFW